MNTHIEINPGELKLKFSEPISGKVTFAELGLKNEDMVLENGLLRLVIDLEDIAELSYYKVPTFEFAYTEEMAETHWQCDFNGETILDKMDHHGRSTVLLLNRTRLSELEHHHQNKLVVHAEFPQAAHLVAEDSYLTLFK